MQGGLDLTGGLGARNAGVDVRNRRDVEQLQTEEKREAESYAALQRKACPRPVILPGSKPAPGHNPRPKVCSIK